jgi:hypothetical protein
MTNISKIGTGQQLLAITPNVGFETKLIQNPKILLAGNAKKASAYIVPFQPNEKIGDFGNKKYRVTSCYNDHFDGVNLDNLKNYGDRSGPKILTSIYINVNSVQQTLTFKGQPTKKDIIKAIETAVANNSFKDTNGQSLALPEGATTDGKGKSLKQNQVVISAADSSKDDIVFTSNTEAIKGDIYNLGKLSSSSSAITALGKIVAAKNGVPLDTVRLTGLSGSGNVIRLGEKGKNNDITSMEALAVALTEGGILKKGGTLELFRTNKQDPLDIDNVIQNIDSPLSLAKTYGINICIKGNIGDYLFTPNGKVWKDGKIFDTKIYVKDQKIK